MCIFIRGLRDLLGTLCGGMVFLLILIRKTGHVKIQTRGFLFVSVECVVVVFCGFINHMADM